MNTKKLKISKTLLAVMMGSALVCGSAMAETTATDKGAIHSKHRWGKNR
ncbi:periplasmic protein [Leclercia adecarboxylata]|uniref:Periplasmic protein n=1 Tax=Leclercia adecarboxylata TaxID=83655 RepID=A0A4U9HMQ1_9ENTR|nr:periplasmic protein [Leclercia adecarboxylata]